MSVDAAERRVRERVEAELAELLSRRETPRLGLEDQDWVYQLVGRMVAEEHERGPALEPSQGQEVWRRVFGSVTPLGPLAEHLADPAVEEVRINGTSACFVLREGRRHSVPPPFADEAALVDLVHWYTDGAGAARLDRASPLVTLTLPDGSRLHAALSPPARPLSVTIRRHPVGRFRDLAEMAAVGFLPIGLTAFLEAAVRGRLNVLIAGGTGAGKTTFMRLLCRLIPESERVVTIEDQAELHLWRELPDCVSLEARHANAEGRGAIGIQLLVHEALRMSPDRIVIGEVRGGEALDLLDAMNTGHPGSVCTLHSDSPRETLPRLTRLALRSPHAPRPEAVAAEVARTVDLVIHLAVHSVDGARRRRLESIGYVAGVEAGQPVVDELVRVDAGGGWRRVGSPASMPARVLAKLAASGFGLDLLDGLDG
ncbi:MAG TPA: ATPase, T2SS/T4P/T4SS family [Candidatus Dormibacteraeota bacterium]